MNTITLESLQAEIAALKEQLNSKPQRKERDYGPKSQNPMTEFMAWRIKFGDLKSTKVRKIADDYGLSRGQVYSVTGCYTFTHVKADDFTMADVDAYFAQLTIEGIQNEAHG